MPRKSESPSLTKAQLEAMIEEATVDAYDEEEQCMGFHTMMDDQLELPFETKVLGVLVTVEGLDMTSGNEIVAVCVRGKERLKVPIVDLPLPSPPPKGAEWIAAYRHWRGGA